MLVPLDLPPRKPSGEKLRAAFDRAPPIKVAMDLGPGQMSPVYLELVPDETEAGALTFKGKVDVPYSLAKNCRVALVGMIRLTLAGSKGWPQPEDAK